jgi:diphthamide synthase (EF-2-diphthine--ammonia ligase)
MRRIKTDEEKKAQQLVAIVSDLRTDLDLVGESFGEISSWVQINRLKTIVEAAEEEKIGMTADYLNGIGKTN